MAGLLNQRVIPEVVREICRIEAGLRSPPEVISDLDQLERWLTENNRDSSLILQGLATLVGAKWDTAIENATPYDEFLDWYPVTLARSAVILACQPSEVGLTVYVGSVAGLEQLDTIRRRFATSLDLRFAPEPEVLAAINQAYQGRKSDTQRNLETLDSPGALASMSIRAGGEDLLATVGKSPVIRLANSIIFDAIQLRASDIHIQPYENHLQVRFRIDGILFDQLVIPQENQEEMLSRFKVMGRMNIAEKRLPQDGRATVSMGDRNIDLRIASLPTSFGERIVIRLLDKGARLYSLEELGMSEAILEQFRSLIHREHGLFLVTGPTGGGKSTTLYAALQELDVKDRNVVTLEDPIEYQLPGISQTQVNEKKGMTFATGLRNVLRQDPDVIMIGEIRDRETAEMAIQSALTGHMVYSTLHTNDSTSAVTRLLDLGIEPYLVASSLTGVLAQRLVRRICPDCRERTATSAINTIGLQTEDSAGGSWQGRGCSNCRETGYQGRVGIFELALVDEQIRSMIQTRSNASEIRQVARSHGMRMLRDDGMAKVQRGLTTVEEVLRVSMEAVED